MKGSYSTVWYGHYQLSWWREIVIAGQAMDQDLEGDVWTIVNTECLLERCAEKLATKYEEIVKVDGCGINGQQRKSEQKVRHREYEQNSTGNKNLSYSRCEDRF